MKSVMRMLGFFSLSLVMVLFAGCTNPADEGGTTVGGTTEGDIREINKISVQAALKNAEVHQESASSADFISANYDPDLNYVILTYKVGTIKDMFLQYLSTPVVADPNLKEFTYSRTVGFTKTEQIENTKTITANLNGTVLAAGAGAGAFAGASASAGLASLFKGLGMEEAKAEAKASAYAAAGAGAAAGKISFDLTSVTNSKYTETYQSHFFETNKVVYDMRGLPVGKKYVVAAFADVGIYQLLKYDPQTKTATAIPKESLWFNVESLPIWGMYEYSREEELSIPQRLKPFAKVNIEVSEDDLYARLEKSQTITFNVGNPRVSGWYRTDWKPITLILPALKELFDYETVTFEWKTYWAENAGDLDCTAHVILDCAARDMSRANDWSYYDQVKNPGVGWKWATWNFSSPIDTVADRPNIRCAYGYDKQEKSSFLGIETGSSYYDLSGTVSVTVTVK